VDPCDIDYRFMIMSLDMFDVAHMSRNIDRSINVICPLLGRRLPRQLSVQKANWVVISSILMLTAVVEAGFLPSIRSVLMQGAGPRTSSESL
jgi:hypothetical protein